MRRGAPGGYRRQCRLPFQSPPPPPPAPDRSSPPSPRAPAATGRELQAKKVTPTPYAANLYEAINKAQLYTLKAAIDVSGGAGRRGASKAGCWHSAPPRCGTAAKLDASDSP